MDETRIVDLIKTDLDDRARLGMQRYGKALTPGDGVNGLKELYAELLDAVSYLKLELTSRDTDDRVLALEARLQDAHEANKALMRENDRLKEQLENLEVIKYGPDDLGRSNHG